MKKTAMLLALLGMFSGLNVHLMADTATDSPTPTDSPTVTATPSSSPTATASSSPTSTPTVSPELTPQIKGNFVNGKMNSVDPLIGWRKFVHDTWNPGDGTPTAVETPSISTTHVHSIAYSALIGNRFGEPEGDAGIYQLVRISPTNPVLSFWYWPHTEDSIQYDWQRVEVKSPNDSSLLGIPLFVDLGDDGNIPNSSYWHHVTFDLGAYAGQSVMVKALVQQDGANDMTYAYFDDFQMVPRQPSSVLGADCVRCGGTMATDTDNLQNICAAPDGSGLYVCEYTNNGHVFKYNYQGTRVATVQPNFTVTAIAASGSTEFSRPYFVDQNKSTGKIYVTDGNYQCQIFSKTGNFLGQLPLNSDGGYVSGVTSDTAGNVYVAEIRTTADGENSVYPGYIQKFSSAGVSLASVSTTGASQDFQEPYFEGIAWSPAGEHGIVYAARSADNGNNPERDPQTRVEAYDAKDLHFLFAIGSATSNSGSASNGSFGYPESIAILPGNYVAVTDWNNSTYTPDGNPAMSDDGTITDSRVQVFTWDGHFVGRFAQDDGTDTACNTRNPGWVGIAYHDHQFYLTDDNQHHGIRAFKQCALPPPSDGSADIFPTVTPTPNT